NAADWIAERVPDFRIKIQVDVFVGKGGGLKIRRRPTRGIFPQKRLPPRTPQRCGAERTHTRRFDRMHFGMRLQARTSDEAQSRVVVVVISPIVYRGRLRRSSVPDIEIEWK